MYIMLGPGQPAEIEQHAVHLAGLHQLAQTGVIVEHRAADFIIPGLFQAAVRAVHGLGLDIHAQHAAILPGQAAEEQRIVAVAAGRVQKQPAGGQVGLQKFMAELHSRQVGHAAAHQPPALG